MKAWDDLVAVALVGCGQAAQMPAPSGGSAALESLLEKLGDQPVERQVLAAAAVLSTWRRAGMRPPALSPAHIQAPPEERAPCPERAADHLARMLQDAALSPLLPEWLTALAAAGLSLPYRWLPEMLDLACQHKYLRPLIHSVIGPRGAWLAAQREAWAALVIPAGREALTERWQNGVYEERVELLRHVRQTDPPFGLELVSSTWPQEPPREREAFLKVLSAGLSMADEPFLEAVLDERRKDVRTAAAELLATLPGSRLCQRTLDRLAPLLHFSPGDRRALARLGLGRKPSLEITLPDERDRAMFRDGLDPDGIEGLGKRNACLAQMLGMVPPEIWCRRWGISPEEALAAVVETEWENTLLVGWARAAIRYHDPAWAEAMMPVLLRKASQVQEQRAFQTPAKAEPVLKLADDVWSVLPAARQEALVLDALHPLGPPLQDGHAALPLLRGCRHAWSETLGRAVLQGLRKAVREGDTPLGQYWTLRECTKEFAHYMPPSLAAEAAEGWDRSAPGWERFSAAVDRFLTVLQFRHDMIAALHETAHA